jgi:hypothetical protein
MREGWLGDEYKILFSEEEAPDISARYGIESMLPGYKITGLLGWDDFLVEDQRGDFFRVPTLPCVTAQLTPFHLPSVVDELITDDRFTGKIKWYIKPMIFGGDIGMGDNLAWITHDQHREPVLLWNSRFHELSK